MLKRFFSIMATAAVAVSLAIAVPAPARADVNVYTTPGRHVVDGRQWNTTCAPYDANITRCLAEIMSGGEWVFNNLTYLASDRDFWFDNPLARPGTFSSDGRDWVTSCNDSWTGETACRTFIRSGNKWIFNNLVYFTPGTVDYPKFAVDQSSGSLSATATPSTRRWALAVMPLYDGASGGAASGSLSKGEATIITQRSSGSRSEVFHNGAFRWVQTDALITEGVEPPVQQPPTEEPGTGGSLNHGNSSGLDSVNANTKKVVRHVWGNYPAIKTMYGWRKGNSGDHPLGRAVDVMLPNYKQNSALGWEIATYFRNNAKSFGVSYVIFDQKIWSVARDREGWRPMSNRGGDTANHIDHVHLSTSNV